jgi:hypothetical protein
MTSSRSTSGAQLSLMVKQHAAAAPEKCRQRSIALAADGDKKGADVWEAIARAAQELIENGPPGDVTTH